LHHLAPGGIRPDFNANQKSFYANFANFRQLQFASKLIAIRWVMVATSPKKAERVSLLDPPAGPFRKNK
jgi:hypothetical protein